MKTSFEVLKYTCICLLVLFSIRCRQADPQNEMMLKPWTGIFFENRNLRSMGFRGPVTEVMITDIYNIRYDSTGMLITDTSNIKPDSDILNQYYRFNRSGLIISAIENDEVYRSFRYRRRTGDLSSVMISGNDGTEDLELLTMKMDYTKRKLTGLQAHLTPFDFEDYFRDISLRSDYVYKDMRDSSSCTEEGRLCITVKPGLMKKTDSLKMTMDGYISRPGTDSFFLPFHVTYIRDPKGLLLSKTTFVPGNGFYGILEPGREQMTYTAAGRLKERIVTGENMEHYYYNPDGKDSVYSSQYRSGPIETTFTFYDKKGNKTREFKQYSDKGRLLWSRTMSYRYDDRDSLTEIMQTAVVHKKETDGAVPFFMVDPFITRLQYNDRGLLAEKIIYTHDSLLNNRLTFLYTREGRLLRETNTEFMEGTKIFRVVTTEYQYDAFGNRIRKLNYLGDRLESMQRCDFHYY